jgi:hypothetical protein
MRVYCLGFLIESFIMELSQVFEEDVRKYFREIICGHKLNQAISGKGSLANSLYDGCKPSCSMTIENFFIELTAYYGRLEKRVFCINNCTFFQLFNRSFSLPLVKIFFVRNLD